MACVNANDYPTEGRVENWHRRDLNLRPISRNLHTLTTHQSHYSAIHHQSNILTPYQTINYCIIVVYSYHTLHTNALGYNNNIILTIDL